MKPNQLSSDLARALDTVDEFLDSLDDLRPEQLLEMAAEWQGHDADAHQNAWTQAVAVAAREGLTDQLEKVREAALNWASRSPNVPWLYQFNDLGQAEIRRKAGPAIADAAVGLLLSGRLDDESTAILMAPWLRTVGE